MTTTRSTCQRAPRSEGQQATPNSSRTACPRGTGGPKAPLSESPVTENSWTEVVERIGYVAANISTKDTRHPLPETETKICFQGGTAVHTPDQRRPALIVSSGLRRFLSRVFLSPAKSLHFSVLCRGDSKRGREVVLKGHKKGGKQAETGGPAPPLGEGPGAARGPLILTNGDRVAASLGPASLLVRTGLPGERAAGTALPVTARSVARSPRHAAGPVLRARPGAAIAFRPQPLLRFIF